MARKRSDPKKLLKEREAILRDMEERENVPQSERMFPNLIEQTRRLFAEAAERKRRKKYPPPRREGAEVTGFGPGNNTA